MLTDQQIDEFLEMLAKSPTSARDMVRGLFAAHEAKAAPAVPQGITADENPLMALSDCINILESPKQLNDSVRVWACVQNAKAAMKLLAATPAAPSQERCCTCGYLTSEREHLGCLRKAVKDLDAATGGPYPSQEPVNRPQNCGTSFCSCIECVCEPPQPVTLTEREVGDCIDKTNRESQYGTHHFGWSKDFAANIIAALREKEQAK